MSTRCQTFITEGGNKVATIYRHCDGYPEGMGLDLCEMLEDLEKYDWADSNALVKRILSTDKFYAEIECIEAKHGDTEYEYYIDFAGWGEARKPLLTILDLWQNKSIKGNPEEVREKIEKNEWV